MAGLEAEVEFIYQKDEVNLHSFLGTFVDGVFAANNSSIETVDAATQRVPITDPTMMMWQMDQDGNSWFKQITGVVRRKLSEMGAYQMIKIDTNNSNGFLCTSLTPICTRVNNVIDGKTADLWQVGDMVCSTLKSYSRSATENREIEYAISNYSAIPGIITSTWGELTMSRQNAIDFYQVCLDYPDQVDTNDQYVFDQVVSEMTVYDPVTDVIDATADYHKEYVYWVETECNSFQTFPSSFLYGTPIPGPIFKPLSKDTADQIKSDKGTVDTAEVLKEFNKEVKLETGPLKLQVKE